MDVLDSHGKGLSPSVTFPSARSMYINDATLSHLILVCEHSCRLDTESLGHIASERCLVPLGTYYNMLCVFDVRWLGWQLKWLLVV